MSEYEMVPVGICQICLRQIRVHKNNRIARHGWNAHATYGFHMGECKGSANLPLERSYHLLLEHIEFLSNITEFKGSVTPEFVLKQIAEYMRLITSWELRELPLVRRYPEPLPKPEPKPERAPEPKPEPKPAPEYISIDVLIKMKEEDGYTLGDEKGAPIVEYKKLKSGAVRLVADRPLKAGELVLIPAHLIPFVWATGKGAYVPTRIHAVNKRGQGIDYIYVGPALRNGEVDENIDIIHLGAIQSR